MIDHTASVCPHRRDIGVFGPKKCADIKKGAEAPLKFAGLESLSAAPVICLHSNAKFLGDQFH